MANDVRAYTREELEALVAKVAEYVALDEANEWRTSFGRTAIINAFSGLVASARAGLADSERLAAILAAAPTDKYESWNLAENHPALNAAIDAARGVHPGGATTNGRWREGPSEWALEKRASSASDPARNPDDAVLLCSVTGLDASDQIPASQARISLVTGRSAFWKVAASYPTGALVELRARAVHSEQHATPTASSGAPAPTGERCADCGTALNEGEAKTFTVCDECWDRAYKRPTPKKQEDRDG